MGKSIKKNANVNPKKRSAMEPPTIPDGNQDMLDGGQLLDVWAERPATVGVMATVFGKAGPLDQWSDGMELARRHAMKIASSDLRAENNIKRGEYWVRECGEELLCVALRSTYERRGDDSLLNLLPYMSAKIIEPGTSMAVLMPYTGDGDRKVMLACLSRATANLKKTTGVPTDPPKFVRIRGMKVIVLHRDGLLERWDDDVERLKRSFLYEGVVEVDAAAIRKGELVFYSTRCYLLTLGMEDELKKLNCERMWSTQEHMSKLKFGGKRWVANSKRSDQVMGMECLKAAILLPTKTDPPRAPGG